MSVGARTGVLKSAALTVAMRWIDRAIGLVSMLLLARLLAPADFGIVAMVALVIGIVDVLLDLGIDIALVQNRDATQAHFDTAWTLRILQSTATAVLICAVSPLVASYFGESRVMPVFWCMAIGVVFAGFQNVGVITFQKEMRFGSDFRFLFAKRIVTFVITIAGALLFRSYWALVLGVVASNLIGTLISFAMHPMRPRLSLERFNDFFSISLSLMLRSIGNYLNLNLHRVFVGGADGAVALGGYSLADEISKVPSSELLGPLNRVIFPNFVRAKSDPVELRRLFLTAQGLQTMVAMPCSVGLAFIAPQAVQILLGDKWMFIVPFVQILSLGNIIFAITTSCGYVMITLGRTLGSALFVWTQALVFLALVLAFARDEGAIAIAWARLASVMLTLPVSVYLLMRALQTISLGDIFGTISRPLLATLCMFAALKAVEQGIHLHVFPTMLIYIVVGALAYAAATVLTWLAFGKPQGAETYAFVRLVELRTRFKKQ